MLSDVIAERLIQLRKAARYSREEFAARCTELGDADVSAATLTNIETGRRDETGRRRRKLTIDELAVFAAALEIPLASLVEPDVEAVSDGHTTAVTEDDGVQLIREMRELVGAVTTLTTEIRDHRYELRIV